MKKKINNIEELHAEKEKLKLTMEMTRHEFAQSIGTNKAQLKEYLMKRVALPIGAFGAATAGYKIMTSSSDKKESGESSTNSILVSKLLPLIVNVISAYFVKKETDAAISGKESKTSDSKEDNKVAPVRKSHSLEV